MYSDPTKIRNNVVKIRLNDEEHRLIQAFVDYTGEQKAPLLRDMLLDHAESALGFDATDSGRSMSSTVQALSGT